jgi:hypothetical protein
VWCAQPKVTEPDDALSALEQAICFEAVVTHFYSIAFGSDIQLARSGQDTVDMSSKQNACFSEAKN